MSTELGKLVLWRFESRESIEILEIESPKATEVSREYEAAQQIDTEDEEKYQFPRGVASRVVTELERRVSLKQSLSCLLAPSLALPPDKPLKLCHIPPLLPVMGSGISHPACLMEFPDVILSFL